MGDFNAHYSFENEWIKDFQKDLDVVDSWVLLQNKGEFPEVERDFNAKHALSVTDHCESIDKIYFRNSAHLALTPCLYRVEQQLFENEAGEPLSDHCAISLQLAWRITR